MESAAQRPKLLVIVGETGSGKSALALKIARNFKGEIISADSWTVYKGFDIGTAKPSKEDRELVRHHMLDIADPADGFNAPKFQKLAKCAIEQIQERGNLPIVVGGTGLYIDSLIYNYSFLPSNSSEERNRLSKLSIDELIEECKNRNIDLAGIDTRNKRRIIRAIESGGQRPLKAPIMQNFLIVGLQIPLVVLRSRIENRVDQMIAGGLEQEVKRLATNLGWEMEPMKGIGYKEFGEYFDGSQSLERTKERIVSNTMQLAKRQRTWFKRNPSIQWFRSAEEAYNKIYSLLNT